MVMDRRKNLIFGIAVFVFTAAWFSFFAAARIDLHHDGVMLKPAVDVAAGKVLFRDTFCQYGALSVWMQALAVKLFGGELIVIQLLTVLFYGGIAVLSDRIFRRFLSFPFRLVNLALFWGMAPFYIVPMHPWSSVYALFFMLLSTEFLLRFIDREYWSSSALAGVFAACAFLARHPCGVVSFGAGVLTLALAAAYLKRKWSHVGIFAAGSAAVTAPFAVYLLLAGAWNDYLRQCFGFVGGFAWERGGGNWGEKCSRLFPVLDGLFPNTPIDIVYSLLPLVCVAVGLKAFSALSHCEDAGKRSRMMGYMTLALTALASWHQYYPVPCGRHLYWAAIPMFGVFSLACERLWRNTERKRACRTAAVLLVLSAALPVAARIAFGMVPFFGNASNFRSCDLPGVRRMRIMDSDRFVLEGVNDAYAALAPHIRARGVFNFTPDAMLSVAFPETGFRHPMFVNWKDEVYRDYPARAMEYILVNRPPVISSEPLDLPGYESEPRFYGELPAQKRSYFFYSPCD
ncbi:MAG: hypothetical protein J6Y54_08570 [Lentisphaeria bacterium]|nr:hypothetical protein [Lentisphaeria bacterium]